jgi:branched-chain amino acid transport system ATP-binding protein
MPESCLHISQLRVTRGGKPVLHDVSIRVPRGQITALLGPNGAGKSTTVMAVAGDLPLLAGQVILEGIHIGGWRTEAVRAAGLAVVPEGHRVLPDLTVRDNLLLAGATLPVSAVRQSVIDVLALLPELEERLGTPARSLSGGQKQMVAFAQALICRPRYLLIDELSLGLAPLVIKRLMTAVQEVVAAGIGVLLIEQFVALALDVATNAYVLEHGHIAWSGSAKELKIRPEILHSSYLAT